MQVTEKLNETFVADSDREFSRHEVDNILLSSERWNFNYKKFEVYRVFVAYEDYEDTFKSRPVVVVKDKGDTVLCLKCTSKRKDNETYYQKYPIENWEIAGFTKPTYICLTSTIEINKDFFFKKLGKLKSTDIDNLQEIGL